MREAILEVVRRHAFPEKPSRLESSFVLESIEEARQFHASRSNEIIYEVEIVESSPNWHRGDWNMVGPNSQHTVLPDLDRFAYAYWEAQAVTRPEIVVLSAL